MDPYTYPVWNRSHDSNCRYRIIVQRIPVINCFCNVFKFDKIITGKFEFATFMYTVQKSRLQSPNTMLMDSEERVGREIKCQTADCGRSVRPPSPIGIAFTTS
jgi:hypothetical protein